ncbi:hypothetical protein AB1Y20_019369 [Prymnesium parvum]|uniref:Prefoldin subunit 4 n=1 Tax=Prymnesium parvum TaxID=97485 RepID=A0AB34JRJ0_PRYPA
MHAPPSSAHDLQWSNDDVEVRWEDQQKINTFGRLNTRMHDLEDEIKEKLSTSELLEDAANEIILADDDEPIRYVFGECYFEVSKDRADELLEGQKAAVDKEIDVLKKELDGINDTLASLKKQLYARFGNNINLEE